MGPGSRDEFDSQGSAAALEEGLMTGRGLRSRAPVAARDASLSPTRDGRGVGAVPAPVAGSPGMTAHTAGPQPLARLAVCLTRAAVRRGSYPCPRLRRAVQRRRGHGGPQGKIVLIVSGPIQG